MPCITAVRWERSTGDVERGGRTRREKGGFGGNGEQDQRETISMTCGDRRWSREMENGEWRSLRNGNEVTDGDGMGRRNGLRGKVRFKCCSARDWHEWAAKEEVRSRGMVRGRRDVAVR